MKQYRISIWFRSRSFVLLAGLLPAFVVPADAQEDPSATDAVGKLPKLYAFCMEIHDAKKRTLPEQTDMLRDLGFDGVGYPLWLDDQRAANLAVLDKASLPVFLMYTRVNVAPDKTPYDPRLEETIGQLRGRPVTICVLLQGLPPGDLRGFESAVKSLRRLGDLAAEAGLRISIYHHTKDWTESLQFTLDVVRRVNHPHVGANFNLCHWLKIEGDRDYRPLLREHADKFFAVTINGAQVGTADWTGGLIQPLDCGDFDNRRLLRTLDEIGYRGPIGLMCYGIPGDARQHLQRSMAVWRSWSQKSADPLPQ
jgi:sugar phosphate isomerase/epimerase